MREGVGSPRHVLRHGPPLTRAAVVRQVERPSAAAAAAAQKTRPVQERLLVVYLYSPVASTPSALVAPSAAATPAAALVPRRRGCPL